MLAQLQVAEVNGDYFLEVPKYHPNFLAAGEHTVTFKITPDPQDPAQDIIVKIGTIYSKGEQNDPENLRVTGTHIGNNVGLVPVALRETIRILQGLGLHNVVRHREYSFDVPLLDELGGIKGLKEIHFCVCPDMTEQGKYRIEDAINLKGLRLVNEEALRKRIEQITNTLMKYVEEFIEKGQNAPFLASLVEHGPNPIDGKNPDELRAAMKDAITRMMGIRIPNSNPELGIDIIFLDLDHFFLISPDRLHQYVDTLYPTR